MYHGRRKSKTPATEAGNFESVQSSKLSMIEKDFERIDDDLKKAQDWFKALWGFDKDDEEILPLLTEFEGILRSIFIFYHEFIYHEGEIHEELNASFSKCERLRIKCHMHPKEELKNIMSYIKEPKEWWSELVKTYDKLYRIHSRALGIMSIIGTQISSAKLGVPDDWDDVPDKLYELPEKIVNKKTEDEE